MARQDPLINRLRINLNRLKQQLEDVENLPDSDEWKDIQRRYIKLLIIKAEELIQEELYINYIL